MNKEKSLKQAYTKLLGVAFGTAPLGKVHEFINEDVMGYGTALDEKIMSIDETITLIKEQRKQSEIFDEFNYSSNPVTIRFLNNGNIAVVIDEIELLTLIKNKSNKLFLRMTAVFELKNESWKLVHWHSSTAEHISNGEDPWHVEEWKKKNQELQRLVEKKTADLVIKNRELEIETSLERVRAIALSMKEPADMLTVCKVISNQLQLLGIKDIRNVQTAIFNQSNKTYINYEYYKLHDKEVISEIDYTIHPKQNEWANEMLKSSDTFFTTSFSGNELNEWLENQRKSSQFVDSYLQKAESLNYYYYSIGPVAIGMSTYSPLNDEDLRIFKKFKNVFELSYKRFIDIKQAEAQAREGQIEAALERVRARSMAMHSSDELVEASDVMFDQMKKLGIETLRIGICTIDAEKGSAEIWSRSEIKGIVKNTILGVVPQGVHPIFDSMVKAWREKKPYFASERVGEEVKDYYKRLSKYISYPMPNKFNKRESIATFFFKAGSLNVISLEPLKKEECDIMIRFANVFEQTYTRFLDLQKAEAQAREAQIEAALERVRSSAMAMHKSDEVGTVSDMLFSELNKLNFDLNGCSLVVINEEKDKMELWRARSNIAVKPFASTSFSESMELLKKYMPDWYPTFIKAVGQRKNYLTDELSTDRRSQFISAIAEQYKYSDTEKAQLDKNTPENITTHYIFFKLGYLALLSEKKLSEENLSIARRFVEVFDFAYTRFLDITKAEAQAREAQIETGLERVRARTMAMQKSNELAQTAAHLFTQLNELGIKPYRCNISIVNKELINCNIWSTTNNGNVIPTGSALPLNEYPVLQEMYNGWKTQRSNHTIELIGSERLEWTKYISKHLPFEEYKINNINEDELIKETAFFTNLYFKQGFFTIHTKNKLTEDQIKVIQRFVYVFEQTYTRFLDLENAEKQNKIIQAENQRKTEELEEARQLQFAMLPTELPKLPNLDIAVFMKTATEVGGDYYDFHVDNKGVLTTVIGDATGHGMKAGTIVTITKSMFNSLASEKNILKVFSQISQVIRDMKFRQLSMCLMMLKIIGNKLIISSAAMPPAFIYRSNTKKVDEIVLNGMPLGAIPNFPYKVRETTILSGDTILLMSDGFPELMNDKSKMYGYEKSMHLFEKLAEKSAEEIIVGLKNSASDWVKDKMPDDDVTFVVIKVK